MSDDDEDAGEDDPLVIIYCNFVLKCLISLRLSGHFPLPTSRTATEPTLWPSLLSASLLGSVGMDRCLDGILIVRLLFIGPPYIRVAFGAIDINDNNIIIRGHGREVETRLPDAIPCAGTSPITPVMTRCTIPASCEQAAVVIVLHRGL